MRKLFYIFLLIINLSFVYAFDFSKENQFDFPKDDLDNLDGVTIINPLSYQILIYNESSSIWYNSYLNNSGNSVNVSDYWNTGDRGALRNINDISHSWLNTLSLLWSNAGHTIDTTFDMNGNNIIDVGNITPSLNNTYSLGSPDLVWKDLYVGPGSVYIGGTKLTGNGTSLVVEDGNVTGNFILGDGSGLFNLNLTNVSIDAELNMNNNNITDILATVYNITGCTDDTAGTLCYDPDFDTLRFVTVSGQDLQMNQETTMPGKNTEGSTVLDSSIVYVIGATGINPNFKLAKADNLSTSGLMGVVTKDCVNNQVCPIIYFGIINDLDTSDFTAGNHLYLSDSEAGNFTTTPPLFPSNPIWVATVIRVHATEGSIFVFPRLDSSNGITMNTLGLVGDFIQTDYKIRSLEGHANLNGKNVMCIEMNGSTGEDVCHVTFQPGGMGQASIWTRSGIVAPEALACLNNTNRTDAGCYADVGGFTWNMDFNTSIENGADWGITGDLEVIKDACIGGYTRLGNIGSGDYAEFNPNGSLELKGNARVQKEIQLNIRNAVKGASAPTETLRDFGASGGVKVPVLEFSQVTQQDIYGEFHYRSDMDDSVNVEFHVMWLPGSGWTSGNYTWCLEYLVKDEESDYNVGTPITICDGGTPNNATQMIETKFTDTIDLNHEQVITTHFYRDVAGDDGDDTGDVRFIEVSYSANKLGDIFGESV